MNGPLSPDSPPVFPPIAAHLQSITSAVALPHDVRLECVTGRAVRDELSVAGLQLDYRARLHGAVSTEEGIAFDPRNVRTQTWVLRAGERPAGVMTVVVEPRDWIAKQRFLRLDDDGVTLEDCSRFTGGTVPRFAVVAGWTNVLPEFRGKFGRAVGPVLQQLVSETAAAAPRGTWVMIGAAGHVPFEPPGVMAEIATMPLGTRLRMADLPINPADFGVAKPESRATVLFADFLGLRHVPNVADVRTLGPAFVLPASRR